MDGTKPYRRKKIESTEDAPKNFAAPKAATSADLLADAANLDRRAWFSSLVPAFGNGLVKILRASNNLRDDLQSFRDKSSDSTEEK